MATKTTHRQVADLFPPRSAPRSMRVGVELELLTSDAADGSVVRIQRLQRALSSPIVGFEPGGQLELSLPCVESITGLERQVSSTFGEVEAVASRAGVRLCSAPMDPRPVGVVPLQLRSPRYAAMQAHFDTIGPAGRVMMRRTASTQLCVDWWPGTRGWEQWRLAHLAGPALSAVLATGDGSRLATWLAVDPSRTAFSDRLLGADPVAAYADFAASAQRFVEPGTHLSTLFPPVRPRGRYLEFRYLDAQPPTRVWLVAAVVSALLYCDVSRGRALQLLDGCGPRLAEDWHTVAADPGDGSLLERGCALLDIGTQGLAAASSDYISPRLLSHVRSLVPGATAASLPSCT